MYAGFSAFDDVRGRQLRKVLQPKACRLRLAVPKLPRLDDLVITSADKLHRVLVRYRVLDGNSIGIGVQAVKKKFCRLLKLSP